MDPTVAPYLYIPCLTVSCVVGSSSSVARKGLRALPPDWAYPVPTHPDIGSIRNRRDGRSSRARHVSRPTRRGRRCGAGPGSGGGSGGRWPDRSRAFAQAAGGYHQPVPSLGSSRRAIASNEARREAPGSRARGFSVRGSVDASMRPGANAGINRSGNSNLAPDCGLASMRPGANRRDHPAANNPTVALRSASGFNEARRESPGSPVLAVWAQEALAS